MIKVKKRCYKQTKKIKMAKQLMTAIAFNADKTKGNKGYLKYRNVNDKAKFIAFLDKSYPDWRYVVFYNKDTGENLGMNTPRNRQVK